MTDLIMPTYGISGEGGTLQKWLKREGDKVQKGESVAEIDTEKAVADLEAPCSGYLVSILVAEGAEIEPGQKLGIIGDNLDSTEPKECIGQPKIPVEPEALSYQKQNGTSTSPKNPARNRGPEPTVKASPGARRLCAQSKVDITEITGTGPQSRIVESDVRAYLERASNTTTLPPGTVGQIETLTPIRRATAARMSESAASIPHFHLSLDVEAKGINAVRNVKSDEQKPSVTAIILKCLGDTLKHWPRLNASWRNDSIELHNTIHVNVAIATRQGLLAPVVRDVPSKTLQELDTELRGLATRAKDGRLRLEDCSPATVTLTNLGMFGITQFDPIINPPQCCILAVGAIRTWPFVNDERIVVRSVMTLTLAVDHRVVDGAEAAQFLKSLAERLENLLQEQDSPAHSNETGLPQSRDY